MHPVPATPNPTLVKRLPAHLRRYLTQTSNDSPTHNPPPMSPMPLTTQNPLLTLDADVADVADADAVSALVSQFEETYNTLKHTSASLTGLADTIHNSTKLYYNTPKYCRSELGNLTLVHHCRLSDNTPGPDPHSAPDPTAPRPSLSVLSRKTELRSSTPSSQGSGLSMRNCASRAMPHRNVLRDVSGLLGSNIAKHVQLSASAGETMHVLAERTHAQYVQAGGHLRGLNDAGLDAES